MAFTLPDYIFSYYPSLSHMEHLFQITIIFAVTVSICYINEFFKTKLRTISVLFLFFSLAAVCLQFVSQLFRNLQNNRVIRSPYYTLMVEFPCLVCDKHVATNHTPVCCDLCDKWVHIYCNNICKNTYQKLKKITLGFINCVYEWKFPFLVSTILNSLDC